MIIERLEQHQKELDRAVERERREIRTLQSFKHKLEKQIEIKQALKEKAKEHLGSKQLREAPPAAREALINRLRDAIRAQNKQIKKEMEKVEEVASKIQKKVQEAAKIEKKKDKIGEVITEKRQEEQFKKEEAELTEITTQIMLRQRVASEPLGKVKSTFDSKEAMQETDTNDLDNQKLSELNSSQHNSKAGEQVASSLELKDGLNQDSFNQQALSPESSTILQLGSQSADSSGSFSHNQQQRHQLLAIARSYGINVEATSTGLSGEDSSALANQIKEIALHSKNGESSMDLTWVGSDGKEFEIRLNMPSEKELVVTIVADARARLTKEDRAQLKAELEQSGFNVRNIQVLKKY